MLGKCSAVLLSSKELGEQSRRFLLGLRDVLSSLSPYQQVGRLGDLQPLFELGHALEVLVDALLASIREHPKQNPPWPRVDTHQDATIQPLYIEHRLDLLKKPLSELFFWIARPGEVAQQLLNLGLEQNQRLCLIRIEPHLLRREDLFQVPGWIDDDKHPVIGRWLLLEAGELEVGLTPPLFVDGGLLCVREHYAHALAHLSKGIQELPEVLGVSIQLLAHSCVGAGGREINLHKSQAIG
mmetsp:Transcript_9781/g.17021  ORF Transcript_9781/g.17021 Transcript_9781/m.17021 type:complete len:240 (+) Transcript_9781:166-885(+)